MAPNNREAEAQWPPRSPHEALVSTPGGRNKYRQMIEQDPLSPSPSKRSRGPFLPSPADIPLPDDDEDDEETLQLKLQELQARIKLKKLQNAKAKASGLAEAQKRTEELRTGLLSSGDRRTTPHSISRPPGGSFSGAPQDIIAVPASPTRRRPEPEIQTSPRRVQLGIDKGLKAKDVSLKRAPVFKKQKTTNDAGQPEGYLRTSRNSLSSESSVPSRSLSFNERLASARTQESAFADRQHKVQSSRTTSFGIGQKQMEEYKNTAVEIPDEPYKPTSFSREEVLSKKWDNKSGLRRSNTTTGVLSTSEKGKGTSQASDATSDEPDEVASFEAYSGLHLSRRNFPHNVLARQVSGKKAMSIKDLLRSVKAPDFSLPDIEQDIVVFGIVAKKSEPRAHKAAPAKKGVKAEDRGKYMVMNLVDLDYEVDLFLFNSGFSRFWKITEGTVVAILNPSVMPPPPGRHDTGRFSLVINSDEDTIIEVGISRDIGYCQTVKKDGDACGAWVNKKRTHFCEFHTNEAVKKSKASRIEMSTGSGFGSGEQKRQPKYARHNSEQRKSTSNYDWETKTRWFVSRSMTSSDLIDGKDQAIDKKEKEAQLQRSLLAKEKEREMMRKLGRVGGGAGKEYMQLSASRPVGSKPVLGATSATQADTNANYAKSQVALETLGLQNKDRTIHLSPVKRKRPISSQAGSVGSSSSGLGWGTGLKDKLARMKEGEKLRAGVEKQQPVEKKTRFVTDKGIREAGRDSLGNLSERQIVLDDDDDDDLIIVR